MLMPKKVKYRKQQRGRMTGKAWRGSTSVVRRLRIEGHGMRLGYGPADRSRPCGDDALIKRGGKVWIRIFPDKPITKKPAETRMGKGKGAPEQWVVVIRPGKIMFEMEGVPLDVATEAMRWRRRSCRSDQTGAAGPVRSY
jgi:large subunit ribosomal protein L16